MTRRDWNDGYAKQFINAFGRGAAVDAYDKSPRNYGKKIATIMLIAKPVLEPVAKMPDSDYDAEGFRYLYDVLGNENYSRESFEQWRSDGTSLWVVQFKVLEVNSYGKRLLEKALKKVGSRKLGF